MNQLKLFSPIAAALFIIVIVTIFSPSFVPAEPGELSSGGGPILAKANANNYEPFAQRVRRQWHVNPSIAEAHSFPGGWDTAACAQIPGKIGSITAGAVSETTVRCVISCLKSSSLDNPNEILACRRSCL
jgi:hypothetical protein